MKRQIPLGLLQTSGSGGKTNATTPTLNTHNTQNFKVTVIPELLAKKEFDLGFQILLPYP